MVVMGLLQGTAACGDDAGGGSGGATGEGASSAAAGDPTAGPGATGGGGDGGAATGTGTTGPGTGGNTTSGPGSTTVGTGGGGTTCEEDGPRAGEGTYYDADGTGNCSFDASSDLVAALNDPDYDGAAWCGACAAVDGPDGSVVVRIVDRCPECASGDLDLSMAAFEQIAPLEAGRVAISWRFVPCEVAGPVAFRFKEGSNPFWSAIQVRNHRHAIASLEALDPETGGYVSIPREDYNYFVWSAGLGPGPYTLRTTDVHGNVLVDEGVPFVEAGTADGTAQLPVCE